MLEELDGAQQGAPPRVSESSKVRPHEAGLHILLGWL